MFECSKCGLCCKHINLVPELSDFNDGSGKCIHLRDDNLCDIYPSRPDICNTEKMFHQKYRYQMTRQEYDDLNKQGCSELKKNIF